MKELGSAEMMAAPADPGTKTLAAAGSPAVQQVPPAASAVLSQMVPISKHAESPPVMTNKRRRRDTNMSSSAPMAPKHEAVPAISPPPVASASTAAPAVGGAGHLVGCEFDLVSMQWVDCKDDAGLLDGFSVSQLPICSFTAKRRRGREEYESERRAQEILRTSGWTVSQATQFEDLECLISTLVRRLENAGGLTSENLAWCVGGSIDATLAGRDANGCSRRLRFALCGRDDWSGDRQSTKAGNTCRWHAGGLSVTKVRINGGFHEHLTLRKCTWMKCCYGRKHYGDPPLIPWCSTCEFQKKVARRAERESTGVSSSTTNRHQKAAQTAAAKQVSAAALAASADRARDPPSPLGSPSSAPSAPQIPPEPCNGCFKNLTGIIAPMATSAIVTKSSKAKAQTKSCHLVRRCGSCTTEAIVWRCILLMVCVAAVRFMPEAFGSRDGLCRWVIYRPGVGLRRHSTIGHHSAR